MSTNLMDIPNVVLHERILKRLDLVKRIELRRVSSFWKRSIDAINNRTNDLIVCDSYASEKNRWFYTSKPINLRNAIFKVDLNHIQFYKFKLKRFKITRGISYKCLDLFKCFSELEELNLEFIHFEMNHAKPIDLHTLKILCINHVSILAKNFKIILKCPNLKHAYFGMCV